MEIFNTIILVISGLLLFMVGTLRISNPIKNYAKNSGITLSEDINLLNEIRGTSGVMLLGGIIILLGIVITPLKTASFVVAILLFFGFAIGRIISILLDGKPNSKLIQGLISELVLMSLNFYCLFSIINPPLM